MANMASDGKPTNIPKLTAGLKNNYPAIRYWAATGLLILADNAASAAKDLEQALLDPVTDVAIVAAEALIRQGQTDSRKKGIETLVNALKHHDVYVRTQALNIIDENNINELTILNAITELVNAAKNSQPEQSRYDLRLTEWLEIKN
jgi:HEAT repeat protein